MDRRDGTVKYNVIPNPNNISEEKVMQFMKETMNDGIWFPVINDCHGAVNDTLAHFGLPNPGAPGGRVGSIQDAPGSVTPASINSDTTSTNNTPTSQNLNAIQAETPTALSNSGSQMSINPRATK